MSTGWHHYLTWTRLFFLLRLPVQSPSCLKRLFRRSFRSLLQGGTPLPPPLLVEATEWRCDHAPSTASAPSTCKMSESPRPLSSVRAEEEQEAWPAASAAAREEEDVWAEKWTGQRPMSMKTLSSPLHGTSHQYDFAPLVKALPSSWWPSSPRLSKPQEEAWWRRWAWLCPLVFHQLRADTGSTSLHFLGVGPEVGVKLLSVLPIPHLKQGRARRHTVRAVRIFVLFLLHYG